MLIKLLYSFVLAMVLSVSLGVMASSVNTHEKTENNAILVAEDEAVEVPRDFNSGPDISCRYQEQDSEEAVQGCYLTYSGSPICSGGTQYRWACWTGSWYCAFYSPQCFYQAVGCC